MQLQRQAELFPLCFFPLWGMLTYIPMALVLPAPSRVAVSPQSYGAQRFLEDGDRSPESVCWRGLTERSPAPAPHNAGWEGSPGATAVPAARPWLAELVHGASVDTGGMEEGGQVSASVCAWGNSRRSTA